MRCSIFSSHQRLCIPKSSGECSGANSKPTEFARQVHHNPPDIKTSRNPESSERGISPGVAPAEPQYCDSYIKNKDTPRRYQNEPFIHRLYEEVSILSHVC